MSSTMIARRAGRNGFTLMEVLIALAIASLTLVTALATVSTGQRNAALAQLKSQAAMLARQRLAELEAGDYPDPPPGKAVNAGATPDQLIWIEEGEFEEEDAYGELPDTWRAEFYWQVIIESASGMQGIRMITVRIYTKRFRARSEEKRWRDYIEKDYRLLVEIATYRAAHFYAETEAK